MLRLLNQYNFKTCKQAANNKEEHRNITNNKQRVLSVFKIIWTFSIQELSNFSSSLTVVFYYDIIDSGRSISCIHARISFEI